MMNDWETFFSAILGATGALLGLLFVGISLNVNKIISSNRLRKATIQPLLLLLSLLITSIFFLTPGQPLYVLGIEVIITGLIFTVIAVYNNHTVVAKLPEMQYSKIQKIKYLIIYIITNLLPNILIIISGICLLTVGISGIYAMVSAIILTFIQVATMSWALVVDINKPNNRRWHNDFKEKTD